MRTADQNLRKQDYMDDLEDDVPAWLGHLLTNALRRSSSQQALCRVPLQQNAFWESAVTKRVLSKIESSIVHQFQELREQSCDQPSLSQAVARSVLRCGDTVTAEFVEEIVKELPQVLVDTLVCS
jgi:hypothetical protein